MRKLLLLVAAVVGVIRAAPALAQSEENAMRVYDDGTKLPNYSRLNFIGAGVTCLPNSSEARFDCTIAGGGGSAIADQTCAASQFMRRVTAGVFDCDPLAAVDIPAFKGSAPIYNPKVDFSAVGDGTTDDTAAVQAAIDAAELVNGIVYVPAPMKYGPITNDTPITFIVGPGTHTIIGTINIKNMTGGEFTGYGLETNLVWDGIEAATMFNLPDLQRTEIRDFKISVNTGKKLHTGMFIFNDNANATPAPRFLVIKNVTIDGATAGAGSRITGRGIDWAFPVAASCIGSLNPWWCCTAAGVGASCPVGVNTNNDSSRLYNVSVVNTGTTVVDYSIEGTQSVEHQFLGCKFSGGAIGVSTGSGADTLGGNFYWINGDGGVTTTADFMLGNPSGNRPFTILNHQNENSTGLFLDSNSTASSEGEILIQDSRIVPETTVTGNLIRVKNMSGTLNLINNRIGTLNQSLTFSLDAASSATLAGIAIGNTFLTSSSTPFTVAHATTEKWIMVGNKQNNNGTRTFIPDSYVAPQPACTLVQGLDSTFDNKVFFQFPVAGVVTGVSCRCMGTCTPTLATFTLQDNSANALTITGTNPTCATGTGNAATAAVTAANTFVAGEAVAFNVTNTPTTGDDYLLCITYTAG